MDIKITFLNGVIEEEVYIEKPKRFETFDQEYLVCRLRKSMYDIKQAPQYWYTQIDIYLTRLGFNKSEVDANLYHILIEEDLAREFEMKDMGLMHYFLRLEVWKGDGELFVSQGKYVTEILQIFRMECCKPMETPLAIDWRNENATSGEEVDATIYWQLVDSLMYRVNTRSDMCYVVN
eukprot:PITA_24335